MNRSLPPRSPFFAAVIMTAALTIACGSGSNDDGPIAVPPTLVVSTTLPPAPGTALSPTTAPQPTANVPVLPVVTPRSSGTPSVEIDRTEIVRLKEVASMLASGQPFQTVVWRKDGQGVYVVAGGQVSFLTLKGRSETLAKVSQPESLLDISSDGAMAVTSDRLTITLRPASGSASPVVVRGSGAITSAHFSSDSTFLAVTLADRIAVQLFDARTGEMVRELTGFETAAPVYSVKVGPDGREIIWHARATAEVQDLVSNRLTAPVHTEDFIADLELKPDRTELVTASGDVLTFWDLEAGEAIDTLKLGPPIRALSYAPSGDLLAVAVQGSVRFMAKADALTDMVPVDAADVEFSPDGSALAIVGQDFRVSLWSPPA